MDLEASWINDKSRIIAEISYTLTFCLDLFVLMNSGFWQPFLLPFREAIGITIHVVIAKLNSYPGCGVTPDSGQASSVKDHETPSIRSQQGGQALSGPPPAPPGRRQREVYRSPDMTCPVFSFRAGIHQQEALEVSPVAIRYLLGADESIPPPFGLGLHILPFDFSWGSRTV
jgi:hypothetical protein